MGLSASQARYLQLTARKSDKEYQAQQINQQRMEIADRLSDASLAYSEGINNRRLMFSTPVGNGTEVNKVALDYKTITAAYPSGLGYKLVDKNGTEIRPTTEDAVAQAAELKAQADSEYESRMNQKYFTVQTEGEHGSKQATRVNGQNFAQLVGFADPIVDAKGNTVDNNSFLENVKNMNEVELNNYWFENGYSFMSGNELSQVAYVEGYEEAAKAREAMYAEAEDVMSHPYIYDDRCNDNDYLETQLRNGEWMLQKLNEDQTAYENINYSCVGNIVDELDTTDDAAVTAEYEYLSDFWQQKDKELELQLQQIQSEHNAIETEIDSVKKVIEKNVDKTFKTFG